MDQAETAVYVDLAGELSRTAAVKAFRSLDRRAAVSPSILSQF